VLLVSWMALLASVAVLTLAVPRLALDTVDQGAREAVAAAGSRADVVVHAPIGQSSATLRLGTPEEAIALARKLPSRLPAALSAALSSATLSLVSPELRVQPQADATASIPGKVAMLIPDSTRGLTVVSGRLPGAVQSDAAGPDPARSDVVGPEAAGSAVPGAGPKLVDIEVAVTSDAARAASIGVGSILEAPPIFEVPGAAPSVVTRVIVVGIVTPSAGASASARLRDLPLAWTPADARGTQPGPRAPGVTLLATPAGVAHAERLFVDPLEANVRLRLDPDAFTRGLEGRVVDEIGVIQANSRVLAGGSEIPLQVSSEFAEALAGYPLQARAAVAQMSLMIAGVLGVAAAVILLLSRLLVLRRADEIALERARGASLASVTLRATVESLLTAAIGGVVGVAVASLVLPGAAWDVTPLLAVGAIAVLSPPAQTLLVARSVWRGRREPANRRERAEIVRRGRARRLVVELGLLVLAAGALFSVRNRGLLQTRTDGMDPLLAAAPLLLATVVALAVLRVYPWVVRAVAVMVRRSRGTLGILGAAQAQRSLGALPLLALTLAVALAVSGGLLLDTVRSGQDAAAWQRVGADVRVEAPVTEADAARVGGSPGVDAAGAMLVQRGTEITDGPAFAIATLLAVDRGYADVLEHLPGAADGPGAVDGAADGAASTAARGLRALAAASAPSDPLPVVVDSELAEQLVSDTFTIRFREQNLRVRLVGIVDAGPVGYLSSPFL
jgi:putative ABC transport system permease protein